MTQIGKCPVCKLIGLLLVLGALNWGAIGGLKLNPVHQLVGSIPKAERIVYLLFGLSGIVGLISCVKKCPCCDKKT